MSASAVICVLKYEGGLHEHRRCAQRGRAFSGVDRAARRFPADANEQHLVIRHGPAHSFDDRVAFGFCKQTSFAVGTQREHSGKSGCHESVDVGADGARINVSVGIKCRGERRKHAGE